MGHYRSAVYNMCSRRKRDVKGALVGSHVSTITDGIVYGDLDITLPDSSEVIHVGNLEQEIKDGRERRKTGRRHV